MRRHTASGRLGNEGSVIYHFTAAKNLARAAHDGDVAKIRKAAENLKIAEQAARQEVRNAEPRGPSKRVMKRHCSATAMRTSSWSPQRPGV